MSPTKVRDVPARLAAAQGHAVVAEQDAMPHVLAAWVRWAGPPPRPARGGDRGTLDAVFNSMGDLRRRRTGTRPSSAWTPLVAAAAAGRRPGGAAQAGVRVPGPAGLALRQSTCPSWTRRTRTTGARCWPPTTPTPAPGGGRHIERHMVLADRLWRGDPPELWEAAQRLLDAGQDRHLVLHALMAVLDHTSGDEASLIAVLRELEADEP